MQYNLFDFLSLIDDPRRAQGQRHSLPTILGIVIMAILSGHQGLKGFARFAKSNAEELIPLFALKHGVPCFGTIRSVLMNLNKDALAVKFGDWMRPYASNEDENWIACDGKGLNSTVNNPHDSLQSFVSVVSAFGHQSGLVYGMTAFDNGKSGECRALIELVETLGLKGAILTMDALHTKKNI